LISTVEARGEAQHTRTIRHACWWLKTGIADAMALLPIAFNPVRELS
jgi:hypothetical protein